jgi:RNA helicase HrpA
VIVKDVLTKDVGTLFRLRKSALSHPDKVDVFLNKLQQSKQILKTRLINYSPKYPNLPVAKVRVEFQEKLSQARVIIVQGETGSGKTTQIPKFCLEMGLSERGWIGCTQPRRIAALSICDRLREELEEQSLVASKIRFHEDIPQGARLKVMTDGILLQEFRKDPWLSEYTCVILDEAHERSLNIDVLLGICKRIWKKRKDFHVVVTSATIDAERFSKFFDDAPVLYVEGRTFPVDIEYWNPPEFLKSTKDRENYLGRVEEAILDLQTRNQDHLLCFLPTEKDILELQESIQQKVGPDYIVLALYGRLGPKEQKRIFQKSKKWKIVLSTNLAETSLTIPDIAYVVDSGLARISRYQPGHRIQGLPIEEISQASANQRSGRAGRVKPGTCIRLFSQEDFESRDAYTDPEILRSNLANVILQFKNLKIDPESFPLLEKPSVSAMRDGSKILFELGALDAPGVAARITSHGRAISSLPIDVTLAHVLLVSQKRKLVEPMLVITAAMSLAEVLIRPIDPLEKAKADGKHSRFKHKSSDFISILKQWNCVFSNLGHNPSNNAMRKFCQENYFSFMRLREWIDLVNQFKRLLQIKENVLELPLDALNEDNLHKILVSGFASMIAQKDPESYDYKLSGSLTCAIFPGSSLFKKKPEWLLASEVRETSKVFLFRCCEIQPEWIYEELASFCKTNYFAQVWNKERGFVEAREKVTFKNFVLIPGRSVDYYRVAPEEAANIFWEDGVSQFALPKSYAFLKHNQKILHDLAEYQEKARQSHWMPRSDQLADWYREQVPQIRTYQELKEYIHKQGDTNLRFDEKQWLAPSPSRSWIETKAKAAVEVKGEFPDEVNIAGVKVKVEYIFDIRSNRDGISLYLPRNKVASFELLDLWFAVPGFMRRLFDSCVRHQKDNLRTVLENQNGLYEIWQEKCLEHPRDSVLLTWAKMITDQLEDNQSFILPKKWDAFQKLHLFVVAEEEHLSTSISPIWDAYAFLTWKKGLFQGSLVPSMKAEPYFIGPSTDSYQFYLDEFHAFYKHLLSYRSHTLEAIKVDGRRKGFLRMTDQLKYRVGHPNFPKQSHLIEVMVLEMLEHHYGIDVAKGEELAYNWEKVLDTLPKHLAKISKGVKVKSLADMQQNSTHSSVSIQGFHSLLYGALLQPFSLFKIILEEWLALQGGESKASYLWESIAEDWDTAFSQNHEYCFWLCEQLAQKNNLNSAYKNTKSSFSVRSLFSQRSSHQQEHKKQWKSANSLWKKRLGKLGYHELLPSDFRGLLQQLSQTKDWQKGQGLSLQAEVMGRKIELEHLRKNQSKIEIQKKQDYSKVEASSLSKLKGIFGKI